MADAYSTAFEAATELYIVTAYLTEWDDSLKLNPACQSFRIIIGKDFGITRKAACNKILKWLPARRKGQFMVADGISGFHPKAVFWKDRNGKLFAIIGSSNLTRAAFASNFEANVLVEIDADAFERARDWVKKIESESVVVSEDWIDKYSEAPASGGAPAKAKPGNPPSQVVVFKLPKPSGMAAYIDDRRQKIGAYKSHRAGLMQLFRKCAAGEKPEKFFDELSNYWGYDKGDRIQGAGWERTGSGSNFQPLAESFVRIVDADKNDRDDVVCKEIDGLAEKGIPTRGAFLSEMLCLRFPSEYPILNTPVRNYLKQVGFRAPRGASEGARYIDLAVKLRAALRQNPNHPAKNLAELDVILWAAQEGT